MAPMILSPEECNSLNIAFNEAEILGVEVDTVRRVGSAVFNMFTLPERGPVPSDRRLQILFSEIGRVGASFWRRRDCETEWEIVQFGIEELSSVVREVKGQSIHGWYFFDIKEADLRPSDKRQSLDWEAGVNGRSHSLTLSPLSPDRALDLTIWCDYFEMRSMSGVPVDIRDVIAGGKRWWDGIYAGDERTKGFGIVAGSVPGYGRFSCPGCGEPVWIPEKASMVRCRKCGAEFHR
jgi:hypothetical protein